jgi:hypothetical protein
LVLRGEAVPAELKDYTDGYKTVLSQTIGETVLAGKTTGMCFGPQDGKKKGYVCHYAEAGAADGDLLKHWVGFYGPSSGGKEAKKDCSTTGKKPSSGGRGKKPSGGKGKNTRGGGPRGGGGKNRRLSINHNSFLNIAPANFVDSNGYTQVHEFGTCQKLAVSPAATNTAADDKGLVKGKKLIASWMQPKEKKSKNYGRN